MKKTFSLLLLGFLSNPAVPQPPPPVGMHDSDLRPVVFRYVSPVPLQSVSLAGTFNGWNKTADPLKLASDGKTWTLTKSLEPEVYDYKFVLNDAAKETWVTDPSATSVSDGNGNTNSRLSVNPEGYEKRPGKVGDGQITGSGVRHREGAGYVLRVDSRRVRLTLRTRRSDVQSVTLETPEGTRFPLSPALSSELFDFWRVTVPLTPGRPLRYVFRLSDGGPSRLYDKRDWLLAGTYTPKWFTFEERRFPVFKTPDWARDAVFYQIFPDRFRNGNPNNDPPGTAPWGSKPTFSNWMGGDLAGVSEKLGYLKSLGVSGIYFNPLFAARSSHGYDTDDYATVSPAFGTNEELKTLVGKAHTEGMRVILDGVFNHTSVDFKAFASLRTKGEKSPYRNWYYVSGFPIEVKDGQKNYAGWFGTPWMPKLNLSNQDARRYLLEIGQKWIREAGIDGWRLDAADEVDPAFWRDFRKAVREVKPDAYIVGECWKDASPWLGGDQWDSTMNYRWRGAVLDFFAFENKTPAEFEAALAKIREDYPPAATAVMFNMISSHDVERFRTLCKGDRQRLLRATLFQFTYPGTPCLYYGDEIGMEGGRDPDNRRAFPWKESEWDQKTLAFTRKAIRLRRDHVSLRRGEYRPFLTDNARGLFGFLRVHPKETALVVFNRSKGEQTLLLPQSPSSPKIWLTGENGAVLKGRRLLLPPGGMALAEIH